MITKLLFSALAGVISLFLASYFVPGVEFNGQLKSLLMAGTVLGVANVAAKPLLEKITLPLRIITLGLFSLIINMGLS